MDFSNLLYIVGAFIPALGLIVFIHEFGHFAVAKLMGMRVFVFSLGFGRRLLGFKWGDTDCRVSLIPLGGYVKLEGEPDDFLSGDDPALERQALSDGTLVTVDSPDYFTNRPRWQRILVYLAGPSMNAVLTIGVLTVFYMVGLGEVDAVRFERPIVGAVEPGSPAEIAGILPGDEILSLDGRAAETWEQAFYAILIRPDAAFDVRLRRAGREMAVAVRSTKTLAEKFEVGKLGVVPLVRIDQVLAGGPAEQVGLRRDDGLLRIDGKPIRSSADVPALVNGSDGRPLRIELYRDGALRELVVTPVKMEGVYRIGLSVPKRVNVQYGFARALKEASLWAWSSTLNTFDTLGRLLTGRLSFKTMAGPIGIARAAGDAARDGPGPWFQLVAIISLQVGILNLLPIAPLDGGHLAILGLESVRRRDLSGRAKAWVMNAGVGILLVLIVLVFYSDLSKTSLLGRFLP